MSALLALALAAPLVAAGAVTSPVWVPAWQAKEASNKATTEKNERALEQFNLLEKLKKDKANLKLLEGATLARDKARLSQTQSLSAAQSTIRTTPLGAVGTAQTSGKTLLGY